MSTINVGIKDWQRDLIIQNFEWGDSLNAYIQEAVNDKLKRDKLI